MTDPPKHYPLDQRCGAEGCGCRFGEHSRNTDACPIGGRGAAKYHPTRVFEPLASAKGQT